MLRTIVAAFFMLALVAVAGCSKSSGDSPSPAPVNFEVLRKADIASKWRMQQVRIDLRAGSELPILLKLADGDPVDGYFYLEKGDSLGFRISASSTIYESSASAGSRGVNSDRFSFVAKQAQGSTYTLTLTGSKQTDATVFLEIVYPLTDPVFTPMK